MQTWVELNPTEATCVHQAKHSAQWPLKKASLYKTSVDSQFAPGQSFSRLNCKILKKVELFSLKNGFRHSKLTLLCTPQMIHIKEGAQSHAFLFFPSYQPTIMHQIGNSY